MAKRTAKGAQQPDGAGDELLVCDPKTAHGDDLVESICMIATKVLKVDLNRHPCYAAGLGELSRKRLVENLFVMVQAAKAAGRTVGYHDPTDSWDDWDFTR